jgi:SH3-like domain-containing protein
MRHPLATRSRLARRALLLCLGATGLFAAPVAASAQTRGATGLALPRYVSLKSDRVNVRSGPGMQFPTQWVFRRAGLPVEVIAESEQWRQVRDAEGATGWVLASLLSGRRTALIEPWSVKPGASVPQLAIRDSDRTNAAEVVRVEAGVIANIKSCDGRWCWVSVGDFAGYVEQRRLWGVYKGETGRW